MTTKKLLAILLMLALLCSSFSACKNVDESDQPNSTEESTNADGVTVGSYEETEPSDTEPVAPVLTPVDIETTGGVVIVGEICKDEQGWYMKPEQPLNITYQYFLEKPSVFSEQTRIKMFDPKDDGFEKALYIGQTVTVSGTFRFYRDDFETLYLSPYSVTIGKNAEKSYGAPDLLPPDEPKNLYDPTSPLPKYMDPLVVDGKYEYNAFMLSKEAIEFMGNDFAVFYVEFVDAFLNYESEISCPDKNYAEMLSTIIYYEFPLYNACAEPFEFVKDYDPENKTVSINYKYDLEEYKKVKAQFFAAANSFLAGASAEQTDEEKAKNIYNALCTQMTYDYGALEEFERKESYYAYLYNSGVCVTFANVYNQLLTQVGIETTVAHCDNVDTIGHSWSIVTLNGQQYFCDPTYELSYDSGAGFRFFGMNYADRTADGLGVLGIRYGRYYTHPLDVSTIAEYSLEK